MTPPHMAHVKSDINPIHELIINHQPANALISCLMCLGGPFVISVYQLPQRFQVVNGLTGLEAGVRLIPFTLSSPVGTGVAASVAGRLKISPIYIILAGALLQVVGFALLRTLPITTELLPRTYGFEIIAGFGCGMNLALLFVVIPGVVEARDQGTSSSERIRT